MISQANKGCEGLRDTWAYYCVLYGSLCYTSLVVSESFFFSLALFLVLFLFPFSGSVEEDDSLGPPPTVLPKRLQKVQHFHTGQVKEQKYAQKADKPQQN